MELALILFIAGMLTILLPCILPLIPIVVGVSIAGRSPWRPLLTVLGMAVSFVAFTFLLHVVLSSFVAAADLLRIATFYVLLLFGLGFLTHNKFVQVMGAVLGGFFFWDKGWLVITIAQTLGVIAMEVGGRVAGRLQQVGADAQNAARNEFGADAPFTAFLVGLTMGLVWVPCAGPALGFALTLVREQPGFIAFLYLSAYAAGTAVPLLLVGYGGQAATQRVRALTRYSGRIKQIAGGILVVTALSLQYGWLRAVEIWLVQNTSYGTLGTDLEERLFGDDVETMRDPDGSSPSSSMNDASSLPRIIRAPELTGLGAWHNSEPLTMEGLRGKVVLVDFWTYSCINCIRTLPHIRQTWETFKDQPFVILGIHTPEFVFEKDEGNVAEAIEQHELTYPIAQDNDYGTWRAFANRYWPAKYLIDAEGYVRYTHFGEGAYEETDAAIASLLAEIGAVVKEAEEGEEVEEAESRRDRTPETYIGARSWPALQNGAVAPSDGIISYTQPAQMSLHKYALGGDWQLIEDEHQVLRSAEGTIRMRFLGGEINLVMGRASDTPATVTVFVDGKQTQEFSIGLHDSYPLWTGEYGEHEIELRISGAGVEAYAFTFGA